MFCNDSFKRTHPNTEYSENIMKLINVSLHSNVIISIIISIITCRCYFNMSHTSIYSLSLAVGLDSSLCRRANHIHYQRSSDVHNLSLELKLELKTFIFSYTQTLSLDHCSAFMISTSTPDIRGSRSYGTVPWRHHPLLHCSYQGGSLTVLDKMITSACILVHVTRYRRLLIGRDCHQEF